MKQNKHGSPLRSVKKMPSEGNQTSWGVGKIHLTHPDRIVYPDQGITKRQLAQYYESVADRILPFVADRPLTLLRCPRGQGEPCFVQRHAPGRLPGGLVRVKIQMEEGPADFLAIESTAGLIALVQWGVLELHAWGARRDAIEQPDRLILDLDPGPEVAWPVVVSTAIRLRELLKELGLTSFLKSTGGKGLHVEAPLTGAPDWDELRTLARAVAERLTTEDPAHRTANPLLDRRAGRIYLDPLRNTRGASAVAPYSTRARPGAPVATPLGWEELTDNFADTHFTVQTLPIRLAALLYDPWAAWRETRQTVTPEMRQQLESVR